MMFTSKTNTKNFIFINNKIFIPKPIRQLAAQKYQRFATNLIRKNYNK
jgi:hypothetical protein